MTGEAPTPLSREVVLVGGGHSHALVLRRLGMRPWPGAQVTLVSDVSHAPYSGMIPGHLAGVYSWEETHIDLRRLASWAGVRFVRARVVGLDLAAGRVLCDGRPPIAFDTVSLNIGSTPAADAVDGAADFAVPAKPVPRFLEAWDSIQAAAARGRIRVLVVGGGAGGVEVALAMKSRLGEALDVSLVHQGRELMPSHPARVRRHLQHALQRSGVEVIIGQAVAAVTADGATLADGRHLAADTVVWTTQASAPPWLAACGLDVDGAGFVVVDDSLRSVSHPWVFAAGDCATVHAAPRPKSGVFAVRAARPLFSNIESHLAAQPPCRWKPQARFLSLIGTGGGRAVASRGRWAAEGAWVWRWKDRIDRAFMRRFTDLPPMEVGRRRASPPPAAHHPDTLSRRAAMRCLGCGGKVGGSILHRVLVRLRQSHPHVVTPSPDRQDIIAGLDAPDDAAVFVPPAGRCVVQTTDYLSALVSDPYVFGRIAANHSMSDILAMGAEPHSALVTALVPFAADPLMEEWLTQVLAGVAVELDRFNALLLGGHTAEAPAPALSLTCTGLGSPTTLWTKSRIHPGDALVLTKPLGTGTLFAAAMQLACQGRWIDEAIDSMLTSNQTAARLARSHQATTATDITGFGLLGHLLEMIEPAHLGATLDLDAIPTLTGATHTAAAGFLSSLHPDNTRALQSVAHPASFASHPHFPLLTDPQTSGGLLIALPAPHVPDLVRSLHRHGCPHAACIGSILPTPASGSPPVTLTRSLTQLPSSEPNTKRA